MNGIELRIELNLALPYSNFMENASVVAVQLGCERIYLKNRYGLQPNLFYKISELEKLKNETFSKKENFLVDIHLFGLRGRKAIGKYLQSRKKAPKKNY